MNFSKTRVRVGVGRQLAAAHAKTSVADRANTLNKEMQGRLLKNMFGCAYLFVEQAFFKISIFKVGVGKQRAASYAKTTVADRDSTLHMEK